MFSPIVPHQGPPVAHRPQPDTRPELSRVRFPRPVDSYGWLRRRSRKGMLTRFEDRCQAGQITGHGSAHRLRDHGCGVASEFGRLAIVPQRHQRRRLIRLAPGVGGSHRERPFDCSHLQPGGGLKRYDLIRVGHGAPKESATKANCDPTATGSITATVQTLFPRFSRLVVGRRHTTMVHTPITVTACGGMLTRQVRATTITPELGLLAPPSTRFREAQDARRVVMAFTICKKVTSQ